MLSFVQYIIETPEQALAYARNAHKGQMRSDNKTPYIVHPTRVAQSVIQYKKSHNIDALVSAAYLHDTLEDTSATFEELQKLFGILVASLVQELTSDKDKIKQVGKTAYLSHKMATMSSYGLVIKLADRLDNVQDIKTAKSEAWRQKYKAETEQILSYIEKNRLLSNTHQRIIKAIRDKINEI